MLLNLDNTVIDVAIGCITKDIQRLEFVREEFLNGSQELVKKEYLLELQWL